MASKIKVHVQGSAPASVIERTQRAIDKWGTKRVREATGLSEAPFFRALAGAPVRWGTVCQITSGLDALEHTQKSA